MAYDHVMNEVVDFINHLSSEDEAFKAASDRMMKELWRRKKGGGEDIAYLLGQLSGRGELDLAKVSDPDCIADLWQIVGAQLQQETRPTKANAPAVDEEAAPSRRLRRAQQRQREPEPEPETVEPGVPGV